MRVPKKVLADKLNAILQLAEGQGGGVEPDKAFTKRKPRIERLRYNYKSRGTDCLADLGGVIS